MPIRDIMVHVDEGEAGQSRLETAIRLAESHGAHLTGLATVTYPELPGFIQSQIGREMIEAQHKALREQAQALGEAFSEACRRAGIAFEWRAAIGEKLDCLQRHGRYCDLLVDGQRDPKGDDAGSGLPDQLILTLGRPVLVVPHKGHFGVTGKRIMIGWDGSRIATHAVHAAMPFLESADRVDIICVNAKGGVQGDGDLPGADLALHLARHDVKAEAHHVVSHDLSAGEVFLSRAAEEGADMLVLGAYGHPRWRELVLGGVTQHVLENMTVPVLMSH
ncbi:MAG: universal stress protein [Rhodospirillales bacterium]